jgi:hypothetical protein
MVLVPVSFGLMLEMTLFMEFGLDLSAKVLEAKISGQLRMKEENVRSVIFSLLSQGWFLSRTLAQANNNRLDGQPGCRCDDLESSGVLIG